MASQSETCQVEWQSETFKPGMHYRFFVCARYAGLPLGAMVPPKATSDKKEQHAAAWPDEHFEFLQTDDLAWEAALSQVGLWSSTLSRAELPESVAQPLPLMDNVICDSLTPMPGTQDPMNAGMWGAMPYGAALDPWGVSAHWEDCSHQPGPNFHF
mmetsp:Transcript_49106/g.142299  ORF Transcript_49106/g.142299 Transcript_49106/m.142299 type:complete len:156 (-) Transcript_49106:142-609(-)